MQIKVYEDKMEEAMEKALLDTVLLLVDKIVEITPRDPKRPPKDPSKPVTWNLKRSITYKRVWPLNYAIWSRQNIADYWAALEFWTIHMKPRSFLRKWLYDNQKKAVNNFKKQFYRLYK